MQERDNEETACLAIQRLYETKVGTATCGWKPEESGQRGEVDRRWTLEGVQYACEHTQITLYQCEIYNKKKIDETGILSKIKARLEAALEPGYYCIGIPHDLDLHQSCVNGDCWAERAMRKIITAMGQPRREREVPPRRNGYGTTVVSGPNGRDSQIFFMYRPPFLWETGQEQNVRVEVGLTPPTDMDQNRREKLHKQIRRKLEKLARAKEAGARTILVCETATSVLHVMAARIMEEINEAAKTSGEPYADEVYLIYNNGDERWRIWKVDEDTREDDDLSTVKQWDYCPVGKRILTTSEARNKQERQWASNSIARSARE